MKQDIRDILKEKETEITLPKNHRQEFLVKLQKQSESKRSSYWWLRLAAVIVIGLAIGFSIIQRESNTNKPLSTLSHIEEVEAKYLKDIETEWQNFVALAEDEVLVERFRKRLNHLSKNYEEISQQFKKDPNNVLVIESLVNNLQTRLQLITDIQHHIILLNQNNEHHENTM